RALEAVERHRDRHHPRVDRALHALVVEVAPAGRDAAAHAGVGDRLRDHVPVVAQVGLAADERHLAYAEVVELPDDVEALVGRELVRPRLAGPRAAVAAAEVARERDLPDDVADARIGRRSAHELARALEGGADRRSMSAVAHSGMP